MEREIVWSAEAERDLKEIYLYLSETSSLKAVEDFLKQVEKKTSMLLSMPFMYPEVVGLEGIRRCLLTSNIAFYYKILDLQIRIIALVDNRQNPDILETKIG